MAADSLQGPYPVSAILLLIAPASSVFCDTDSLHAFRQAPPELGLIGELRSALMSACLHSVPSLLPVSVPLILLAVTLSPPREEWLYSLHNLAISTSLCALYCTCPRLPSLPSSCAGPCRALKTLIPNLSLALDFFALSPLPLPSLLLLQAVVVVVPLQLLPQLPLPLPQLPPRRPPSQSPRRRTRTLVSPSSTERVADDSFSSGRVGVSAQQSAPPPVATLLGVISMCWRLDRGWTLL